MSGSYQLKRLPEDFQVQEVLEEGFIQDGGGFAVYLMEKRDVGTQEAVETIAARSGVPIRDIRFGGRKDKRAVTRQFITAPKGADLSRAGCSRISLQRAGFSASHISPSKITHNRFTITIRGLEDPDRFARRISMGGLGFPNYFDDQRFGSVGASGAYFAERLIKGHLNGALKVILTDVTPEDTPKEAARKSLMAEAWGDFGKCLSLAAHGLEKKILSLLAEDRSTRGMKGALRLIPREQMSMLFSAYQSFLWNLTVSRLFEASSAAGLRVVLRGGEAFFPFIRPHGHPMMVPTASYKMPTMEGAVMEAFNAVLEGRGIKTSDFNIRFIRSVHFGSYERSTWQFPTGLRLLSSGLDQLNPGKHRATLEFSLERGSYATMFIRYLMELPA
ncbi:MAG: tRNA pseudouridine(13) synthase TruD [Thermanaerothrix sp.]|nr:tRNA pseudouridine(13) synthase TruD [Thermanaerothrix sp.]